MSETHRTRKPGTPTSIHRHPVIPAQPASCLRFHPATAAAQNRQSRLGLLAFVQLHQSHYLLYARTRLDETVARAAVAAALDTVAHQWDRYLQCARPAADAWRQLSVEIDARSRGAESSTPALARLYRSLPHDTADAAVLCWQVRLTSAAIADLMGIDLASVAVLLLAAQRHLPAMTLEHLEDRTPLL
ncbi:hypothetical protein ACF08M_34770 [Streptomyces sp. NPDC015032]|uniref:hypothetical protein n=1 Tax=Streptomyces sp. NPDC015032 TaxID=3364937 RepID=UPI003702D5A6